jgi:hypothetical protein
LRDEAAVNLPDDIVAILEAGLPAALAKAREDLEPVEPEEVVMALQTWADRRNLPLPEGLSLDLDVETMSAWPRVVFREAFRRAWERFSYPRVPTAAELHRYVADDVRETRQRLASLDTAARKLETIRMRQRWDEEARSRHAAIKAREKADEKMDEKAGQGRPASVDPTIDPVSVGETPNPAAVVSPTDSPKPPDTEPANAPHSLATREIAPLRQRREPADDIGSGFEQVSRDLVAGDRERGRGVHPAGAIGPQVVHGAVGVGEGIAEGELPGGPEHLRDDHRQNAGDRPGLFQPVGFQQVEHPAEMGAEGVPGAEKPSVVKAARLKHVDIVAFRSAHHPGSGEAGKGHHVASAGILEHGDPGIAGERPHRLRLDRAVRDLRKLIDGDLATGFGENPLVVANDVRLAGVRIDRRADREAAILTGRGLHLVKRALDRACPFHDPVGGRPKRPDKKPGALEKLGTAGQPDQDEKLFQAHFPAVARGTRQQELVDPGPDERQMRGGPVLIYLDRRSLPPILGKKGNPEPVGARIMLEC